MTSMRYLNSIPRYVIYATLIFTPFARASVEGWAITMILIVTLAAASSSLISRCLSWEWKWTKTPLDLPFIVLIILSIFSGIFSVNRDSSFWAVSLLICYILLFYLSLTFIQFRVHLRNTQYIVIIIASLLSVFGFIKLIGLNPFSFYEYSSSAYRLSSTYVNPDHFAGYIEMALPLLLGTILTGYHKDFLVPMFFAVLLLIVALIYTFSRGGWISLFVGLISLVIIFLADLHMNKKKLIILLSVALAVCLMILLASTPLTQRLLTLFDIGYIPNFRGRIIAWEGVVNMIQDYPFLGTGPGTFSIIFSQYQPPGTGGAFYLEAHNDYLHFVSDVGLLLIPIILWMAIVLFRKGIHKLKNPSHLVRGVTAGAMSGIVSMLVHSIVDFNLHIPANAVLFTILVAIVAAPIPEHIFAGTTNNLDLPDQSN